VIEGLSGKTSGNLLEITSFGLGEGKFGTISVSNVNISVNQEVDQNRAVVTINNNIDNLNLTNITIQGSFFNHDAIRFGSDTDIGLLNISNLVIDQSVSNMGSRGLNFTPGSYIDKVSVSGYHFKGIGIGGTSVDLQSLEARTFTLSESSVDSANNTIISNGANIGNLVLRDNFGASNNGISLINANIDTLHIYGSYFKTQGLAFTADAPSTIGLIKTTLLGQNDASNQSSLDVLKYKKAGVVYEVNPGPGDLSNYVTTNTTQTITGTKTFTQPVSSTSFVATGAALTDGMNIISGSNNSGGMVAISGNETKAAAFLSSDNSFVVGYGTVTPGQHSAKFSIDLPTGNATFAGRVSGAPAVNSNDFVTLGQIGSDGAHAAISGTTINMDVRYQYGDMSSAGVNSFSLSNTGNGKATDVILTNTTESAVTAMISGARGVGGAPVALSVPAGGTIYYRLRQINGTVWADAVTFQDLD
jgi:hypothetical protein